MVLAFLGGVAHVDLAARRCLDLVQQVKFDAQRVQLFALTTAQIELVPLAGLNHAINDAIPIFSFRAALELLRLKTPADLLRVARQLGLRRDGLPRLFLGSRRCRRLLFVLFLSFSRHLRPPLL